MGGPPQPGEIMPGFMRDELNLSPEQNKELDALQKEVKELKKQLATLIPADAAK